MVSGLSQLIDVGEDLDDEVSAIFYASEEDTQADTTENSSSDESELATADFAYHDGGNVNQNFLLSTKSAKTFRTLGQILTPAR